MMNDEEIISAILQREGGGTYTNNPADKGGPTKYGVTEKTLAWYRGAPVREGDVEALTEYEARAIYRQQFVVKPGFDKIDDDNLRALLVDWAVNSGPAAAIRGLQRVLNVPVDGVLGPVSLLALPHLDAKLVYRKLCAQRVRFLGRIITDDPSQAVFAAGWLNRVAEFVEAPA